MKVIRQASDVADVADPVIREFLARRINHMVTVWAPDLWPDFGQLLRRTPCATRDGRRVRA